MKLLHPQNMVLVNTGLKTPVIFSQDEAPTARVHYIVVLNLVGIQDSEEAEGLRSPRIVWPEPCKPNLFSPERLNKKRVWIEPTRIWRDRERRVKGFLPNSMKGGYAVAIAGPVALLPRSLFRRRRGFSGNGRFNRSRRFVFKGPEGNDRKGVGLRFDGGRGFVGRKRFSRNGWIKFKILNMNPKDWNIVVEAICAAPTFSKRKKHQQQHMQPRAQAPLD